MTNITTHLPIGAQPYIFSKTQNPDWDAILGGLKAGGYAAIEGGIGRTDYVELCAKHGLIFAAVHSNPGGLKDVQRAVDFLLQTEARDICTSGLMQWHERSADDYKRTIEFLNQTGAALRAQGIYLHYHNHDFEFESDENGVRGIELLCDSFDKNAVDFCLDAGWAAFAGTDAAQWMRDYAAQIGFLHLRDFKNNIFCPLGQGEVDLRAQLETLPMLTNLRGIMIEQDPNTDEPLQAMNQSRAYLKEEFGI